MNTLNLLADVIRYGVCSNCGSAEHIVYSGVDALVLGVTVGHTCYTCANGGYEYAEEAM